MPLSDRQKRIYASAPTGEVVKQALVLSHPGFPRTYYITNYPVAFEGIVNGVVRDFEVVPFRAVEPKKDDTGHQDLRIAIDNVGPELMEALEGATSRMDTPIECIYLIFADKDPSPQNDPPLYLQLTSVEAQVTQIVGAATRADIVNAAFPRRIYRTSEFPGLDR
jgi:hypothetical protein